MYIYIYKKGKSTEMPNPRIKQPIHDIKHDQRYPPEKMHTTYQTTQFARTPPPPPQGGRERERERETEREGEREREGRERERGELPFQYCTVTEQNFAEDGL